MARFRLLTILLWTVTSCSASACGLPSDILNILHTTSLLANAGSPLDADLSNQLAWDLRALDRASMDAELTAIGGPELVVLDQFADVFQDAVGHCNTNRQQSDFGNGRLPGVRSLLKPTQYVADKLRNADEPESHLILGVAFILICSALAMLKVFSTVQRFLSSRKNHRSSRRILTILKCTDDPTGAISSFSGFLGAGLNLTTRKGRTGSGLWAKTANSQSTCVTSRPPAGRLTSQMTTSVFCLRRL